MRRGLWESNELLLMFVHLIYISDGPTSISLDIRPATLLKNGTLYVNKSSDVYFNCSSVSRPSQNLTWTVENLAQDNHDKASGSGSTLKFFINRIQPQDQGMYTCTSQNTLSMRTVNKSQELLVYCKLWKCTLISVFFFTLRMLKSFQESFPVYNLFCLLDLWYIGCNCLYCLFQMLQRGIRSAVGRWQRSHQMFCSYVPGEKVTLRPLWAGTRSLKNP